MVPGNDDCKVSETYDDNDIRRGYKVRSRKGGRNTLIADGGEQKEEEEKKEEAVWRF